MLEVPRSVTTNETGESIEVPTNSAALDGRITRDHLRIVQQCLQKHSINWYCIGFRAGVPKDTLDLIDRDCPDTPRRLIEMIDVWINRGRGCTWGSLARALNDSGHRETANKVIAMASEVEIQVTECLSAKSWQSNEATVCEHRELFQSKLQLANDSYQEFTSSLRELLSVPDTVEDTTMLNNIDIYIDGNCNFLCEFVDLSRLFVDVTEHLRTAQEHLRTAQEHLHIWDNVLTKDNDMVCDRLRMLAIEKEELKEKLYLLAVKSQRHTEYDRQKRETQAKKD